MSRSNRDRVFDLAGRQLPCAALYGIGGELEAIADELEPPERLLQLATGFDDHGFGLLGLTDRRLFWVASGDQGCAIRSWPRAQVEIVPSPDARAVRVESQDETWEADGILPASAIRALRRHLASAPASRSHRAHQTA